MNLEEFNHFQNQIDNLRDRLAHIEQSVAGFQLQTCPCEHRENGNCTKCIFTGMNQIMS